MIHPRPSSCSARPSCTAARGDLCRLLRALAVGLWLAASFAGAQTLNLPPRPVGALTGSQFVGIISFMSVTERENWICAQALSGNVPNFLRTLKPITVNATIGGVPHSATYYVTPDYLAIGTDTDYFLEPMTPLLAQRLCNAVGYSLPTRKMVNQIWTNAAVKLTPQPISPSGSMTTVPVFADHNSLVRTQRSSFTNSFPLGALVAGDKKDVVISTKIYTNFAGPTDPVVIYGWHYTSGVPIQGLVNVHESTYADYSHGIRLVQMAMTVDGSPNSVTNVLTSPSLAALLSDEGPSEGTTSDAVIRTPRYTVGAVAPVLIRHPRTVAVLPGCAATLQVLAAGDPPLACRWYQNGSLLPGATNASLVISNVQPPNLGAFTAVVTNNSGSVTSRPALLTLNTNVHPVLFADAFETDTSGNWNLFWGASNNVPDYTAEWAWDYGATPYPFNGVTNVIPPAPNSADGISRALRLTVNNNDTNPVAAAVNVYPKGRSFSGNFALKFDLWINYPGGPAGSGSAGSTEHAIFGVNHLGTQVNWAAPSASSSDGLWFGADGEGGESKDYRAYAGNLAGTQIDLLAAGGSGMSASNNTAALYQNLFPSTRFETAGSPGKNWVQAEIRQTNNVIVWLLDGTVIALRTNTFSFTSGDVMLGFMDTFPSIAAPAEKAFVLFDNVRVEDLSAPALQPPSISAQPQSQSVETGGVVTLSVSVAGSSPLTYQWRHAGTNLPGATGSSLLLTNMTTARGGLYDLLATNLAGAAASAAATLTVTNPPVRFDPSVQVTNSQVHLSFSGVPGVNYAIEASTNLDAWEPIATLTATNGSMPLLDTTATNCPQRFYRARQVSGP